MVARRVLLFRLLACCAWPLLISTAAAADLPRKNLWVELRWVDSSMNAATLGAVRDGGVVVGTLGAVSPRGHVSVSTQQQAATQGLLQRVLVLNGQRASVQFSEQESLQWLDYGLQFDPAASAPLASLGANPGAARVWAAPRQSTRTVVRGFNVTPHWPGGQQPVRLEWQLADRQTDAPQDLTPGAAPQMEMLGTVLVPLGQWVSVARSGGSAQAAERGVVSTRDVAVVRSRELQLRVELAP